MPRIHYWELSNYNAGRLVGRWFDLEGHTHDSHLDEIQEWLEELTEEHIEGLRNERVQLAEGLDKLQGEALTQRLRLLEVNKAATEQLLHCEYEEWLVGDVEDVPKQYVSEWSIDEDFFEYLEACDEHGEEITQAAVDCGIQLDKISDAYYGYFESDEKLAEEYIDSGCMGDIPDHLINYIDTERLGRDLAYDFYESDGHYFHTNY